MPATRFVMKVVTALSDAGSRVSRTCEYCGITFAASKKEVNRGNAKFCSRSCSASESNRQRGVGPSQQAAHNRARQLWKDRYRREPACRVCKRIPADIHHEDGDITNNAVENQIPLCRAHHTALENSRFPKRKRDC